MKNLKGEKHEVGCWVMGVGCGMSFRTKRSGVKNLKGEKHEVGCWVLGVGCGMSFRTNAVSEESQRRRAQNWRFVVKA